MRVKAETDALGYRHTTYQQVHNGVPVFSGVIKVHRNGAGDIVAANGDFYPSAYKVRTTPALDAEWARRLRNIGYIK